MYHDTLAQRVQRLIFVCLALFFVGATAVWLALDRTPASWDDAYYLKNSFILYDNLADGGIAGFVSQFLHGMRTKPPLIAVLPAFAYWIGGRRIHAAYAVNLFFMLVLFGALFHLGKKYAGSRAGLLAVFVAGTMPMLYGLSHWFLAECGLTALVCIVISIIASFNERIQWSRYALLGVVFGLGLLMKMSFPVYVLVPLIYFAMQNRKAVLKPRALATFAAAVAVVALPWYLINFSLALQTALNAGSAGTAKVYGTGDILSWPDIWSYLVKLANAGPAIYFLLLLVLGAFHLPGSNPLQSATDFRLLQNVLS
jgi:4-amino-4-deoxy-L-arabinose transferase-like glycosyltransferase